PSWLTLRLLRLTVAVPSMMRKNSWPVRPSSTSTRPAFTATSSEARAILARSCLLAAENRGTSARWSRYTSRDGMARTLGAHESRRPTVHVRETVAQQPFPTVGPMDVVVVRWPAEAARREQLAQEHVPRLLLVDEGTSPPDPGDCLED